MLTIYGNPSRYCDGVSRRTFLRIGALGVGAGALTLADLFRAEARAGVTGTRHKAVINIYLCGGPPHQDLWDLKPEAPAEIRGEFRPIATRVPGLDVCEVFPRLAARMDRCVVLRSVVGSAGRHDAVQCLSGWPESSLASVGGRPSLGAVLARLSCACVLGSSKRTTYIYPPSRLHSSGTFTGLLLLLLSSSSRNDIVKLDCLIKV